MTELMVVRCNFGDWCTGRVLNLCNIRISDDTQISEPTRDFLRDATYVDDGATSSQDMATVELIAGELGPLYHKYSFKMKHCLKNYEWCKGKTTDETHEEILGLQWDFLKDTLRPHLTIYLSSKKRGLYTDSKLSIEGIQTVVITQRFGQGSKWFILSTWACKLCE